MQWPSLLQNLLLELSAEMSFDMSENAPSKSCFCHYQVPTLCSYILNSIPALTSPTADCTPCRRTSLRKLALVCRMGGSTALATAHLPRMSSSCWTTPGSCRVLVSPRSLLLLGCDLAQHAAHNFARPRLWKACTCKHAAPSAYCVTPDVLSLCGCLACVAGAYGLRLDLWLV